MPSSFLLRVGLLLVPIFLLPLAQLIQSGAAHTDYYLTSLTVSRYILNIVPLLFAVFASLTEPNISRSWQIISTIVVYFFLQFLFHSYFQKYDNSEYASAFCAALISGALSSHITANTDHLRRYFFSRILNLSILLIGCVLAFFVTVIIFYVIDLLFISHDSGNILMGIPSDLRSFICMFAYQLAVPFGLDSYLAEFIMWDPYLNTISHQYVYVLIKNFIPIYGIAAMLLAVIIKQDTYKFLPVFFLMLISLVSGIFEQVQPFVLLMILWIWSGLFFFNALLAGLIFVILLNVNLDYDLMFYYGIGENIYDDYHSIYVLIFVAAVYFFGTLFIIKKFSLKQLTWKLKKQKKVSIKLIRDKKNSKDLSLLAIRILKIIGGLDNIKNIRTDERNIVISYYNRDAINVEALKGIGSDSYYENKKSQVTITTSSSGTASSIVSKIVVFAHREFLDLNRKDDFAEEH